MIGEQMGISRLSQAFAKMPTPEHVKKEKAGSQQPCPFFQKKRSYKNLLD
jgi:hypothetical protein